MRMKLSGSLMIVARSECVLSVLLALSVDKQRAIALAMRGYFIVISRIRSCRCHLTGNIARESSKHCKHATSYRCCPSDAKETYIAHPLTGSTNESLMTPLMSDERSDSGTFA